MKGFVGGILADRILGHFPRVDGPDTTIYDGGSKLEVLFGLDIWAEFHEKTVIDFGCGDGKECVEIAKHGAQRVIGLEIRPKVLDAARERARAYHLTNVSIADTTREKADIILSLDSFEHFGNPAAALNIMAGLLKPNGCVLASFGPIWGHPLGGHMFSVFPWAHLIFTESALMRWRRGFRSDNLTRFAELPEPLNRMTIHRFKRLIEASPLRLVSFCAVPIRGLRHFHNRLTQEFLTSVVQCRLEHRKGH